MNLPSERTCHCLKYAWHWGVLYRDAMSWRVDLKLRILSKIKTNMYKPGASGAVTLDRGPSSFYKQRALKSGAS